MTSIVAIFNTVLNFFFGLFHGALKGLGPFWSLVGLSILGGILLVWLFGKVSNQHAIREARNRLSAELIALRLFKDDLRVFFGVQGQVLIWTVKYLKHSLIPMVILMVPAMVLLIQLNLHYGLRPLAVGESAVVKVKLRSTAVLTEGPGITLQTPPNLRVETEGVRIEELKEISWRVRGVSAGRFELLVTDGKTSVSKKAAVGGPSEGVSSLRTGAHWMTNLLYPDEAPIANSSAIESIEILYPELALTFLGWHVNWMILFFILSLIFGYLFKGVLGVQI